MVTGSTASTSPDSEAAFLDCRHIFLVMLHRGGLYSYRISDRCKNVLRASTVACQRMKSIGITIPWNMALKAGMQLAMGRGRWHCPLVPSGPTGTYTAKRATHLLTILQCCVTVFVHQGIHVMTLHDVTGSNNTVSTTCTQREVRCMMGDRHRSRTEQPHRGLRYTITPL